MKCVGIDTSCDDTAIGMIDENRNIIAEEKMSLFCGKYGGVVPELAARNHLNYIDKLFMEVTGGEKIDLIGATVGPGLLPGLVVGSQFAKTYANLMNIPFVPVHHLEGHIEAAGYKNYPFIALLISGGHSDIYICHEFGKYELMIKTLDDAAGEVFDKIGRNLQLPFPSGPYIEQLAKNATIYHEPMVAMKGQLAFSFSGLKTKTLRINDTPENISWFLQESIALTLKEKLSMIIERTNIHKIVVCGGVSANLTIRNHLNSLNAELIYPPLSLCADNGPMIAFAAYEHYKHQTKYVNNYNIPEFSRMSLSEWNI